MAQNSKQKQRWERYDAERLASAVAEIGRSPNLRYFIRNLLGAAGVQDVFPTTNALEMARAAGRHELGLSVIATLTQHQPALYPELLLEEQNELAERTSPNSSFVGGDRGEPEFIPGARDDDY